MTSSRPYLIRAFYDWILDNELTPHLLVDATRDDVVVPQQHVQDGQIILNISPLAISGLELGNDLVSFSARFSGSSFQLSFPPDSVLGIYARENGRGMLFEHEPSDNEPPPEGTDRDNPNGSKKPSLKVVK